MSETPKNQKNPNILRVRGSSLIDTTTGDFEFKASQPGNPVKKNERKRGQSNFYETEGVKDCNYVCHIKVPKDCPDPATAMMEELEYLTRPLVKKPMVFPRGKRLLDSENLVVVHNRKDSKVIVQMAIDLLEVGELSSKLFNLTAEVNKCFAINRTSLLPRK